MGICRTMKRIVPIDHLRSKKTLGSSQDGSREFISLLATICADGSALTPALIYQGIRTIYKIPGSKIMTAHQMKLTLLYPKRAGPMKNWGFPGFQSFSNRLRAKRQVTLGAY